MTLEAHEPRRLSFGSVAELYDAARPTYPEALVDDVLAYAGAGPGDRALEVGAGTGKATVLFARRGLRITALEPNRAMASIARRNCARDEQVVIEEAELEHWHPAPAGGFRLVFSAQAWHWVDPDIGYSRAREAVADGGALAVFWNRPRWETCELRQTLAEAYTRAAPEFAAMPGPMHPTLGEPPEAWGHWRTRLEDAPGFVSPEARVFPWSAEHTTDDYLRLLRTHSDHIVLGDDQRERLLAGVGEVISGSGGSLRLDYEARLWLLRASGEGERSDG